MANLPLSIAVGDYDHMRDLTTGRVVPDGIEVRPINVPTEEMFFRFIKFQEFDVSEVSFAKALAMVSQPNPWLVLIPVFPSRAFRHSSIYVRQDGDIKTPMDLAGKKIGIPEWAQTASIYSRGMLAHEYGVDLTSIEWFQAGVNDAGRREKVKLNLPAGIRYTACPDKSISQMLLSGEIDAALSARAPDAFIHHPEVVKRLFTNYREVEQEYWQRTQIFPIMHVIAIKRTVYEANPWIARSLMNAFELAKDRSLERAADITASYYPIPWAADYAHASQAILGKDFWPYGFNENASTLEAFTQYAFEHGITSRKMAIDEIFVPEVREKVKV